MGTVYGYARTSTTDQDPDLQRKALVAAGCSSIIDENGPGGHTNPKLARLLASLQPGDTLVVWRLDRLGRSLANLVDIITGLQERRIEVRSLHEQIDTASANGRFVLHIFAALAEFERDLIKERVNAGIASARSRGKHMGRPAKLSKEQAAHAREMIATGKSIGETARILGVGRGTIWRTTHSA